jgi:hypothetical protein
VAKKKKAVQEEEDYSDDEWPSSSDTSSGILFNKQTKILNPHCMYNVLYNAYSTGNGIISMVTGIFFFTQREC